jgi:hypothetical protein
MSRNFPGTAGNRLDGADNTAVDITGTLITIAAWVKPDVVSSNHWIASKDGTTTNSIQYRLHISTSKVVAGIGDSGGNDLATGATNVATGVWSHCAAVKNGTGTGSLKAYLNGAEDASITSGRSMQARAEVFVIGSRPADSGIQFDGQIAEVAIWNVALTAAEIAALARGVRPFSIRRGNLKGYWPLLGTGSPERDYSGNGQSLTVVGSVPADTHAPVGPMVFSSTDAPILAGQAIYTESDTVNLDLQASGSELAVWVDSATIYEDLAASGVDLATITYVDAATVYEDLSASASEQYARLDAGTILLDLLPENTHDCVFPLEPSWLANGTRKWAQAHNRKWAMSGTRRWAWVEGEGQPFVC